MDPTASFGDPIDTFSNTFSTDKYADLFTLKTLSQASPEIDPTSGNGQSPAGSDAFASSKSPTSPSNAQTPASGINPRSCTTCRKRKVRCDKKHPCSNCHKAGIECIFPRPGRAPRRSKKPPDSELLARLRRLEGVVQSLGKGADGEDLSPDHEDSTGNRSMEKSPSTEEFRPNDTMPPALGRPPSCSNRMKISDASTDFEMDLGKLYITAGKSRYISNNFWANLTSEIAEMQHLIDESSEEEEYGTPESDLNTSLNKPNHTTFIFGYSSAMITLRILHPPKDMVPVYWEAYKENVNPLIRVLHRPTVEKLVLEAGQDLDSLSKSTEALVFAIYLAVVTSLSPEECQGLLKQDKSTAIQRYRFACEQALARAQFLETTELVVLQAFTLFLVSARRHDDTRFVWTMTGLATRISNAMGIHRDGEHYKLPPFETEMRRRLWWQICTLDIRASEELSSDPTITEQMFDTKLPSNVNDEDIWPGMTEPPKEHVGCTEMTFDLIRYEVGNTARFLNYTPPGAALWPSKANESLEDKERLIQNLSTYLEDKYLKYCDMSIPLQWVAANILAKMWLIVHHPFRRADGGAGLSMETRNRLFRTSVDVIRYSRTLESERSTMKWGWLFRTYIQWHAVAFVLFELSTRTLGPEIDSTWHLMNNVFEEWGDTISTQNQGTLWKPIKRLMAKARHARAQALEKAALFPTDGSVGPTSGPRMSLPSSLDGSLAFTPIPPRMNDQPQLDPFAVSTPNQPQTPAVIDGTAFDPNTANDWALNDPTLLQDTDEKMTWDGWDEMVKDFSMEQMQDQPIPLSMGSWW
ncbi:hypothetical protein MMC13_005045 [Lambiella insularis]|nr:hypothetical protein [Lambiella insularis]